jgi:hypothetical protein
VPSIDHLLGSFDNNRFQHVHGQLTLPSPPFSIVPTESNERYASSDSPVAFEALAFKTTFFIVQRINSMEDLKQLLIDRLKFKGMEPALIPAFLRALTSIISSEPGIDSAVANQKMHSLGWNEVAIDYHCLQIAIACLEADTREEK